VPFVLQRRAQNVIPTFSKLLEEKDYETLTDRLDQLIDLIIADAKAHVHDVDSGTIERDNVAFLDDCAIHLDVGTLMYQEDTLNKNYLEASFTRLDPVVSWLQNNDPQLATIFQMHVHSAIKKALSQKET